MYRICLQGLAGLALILVFLSETSCVVTKNVVFLHNLQDSASGTEPIVLNNVTPYVDPVILTNDLLSIVIQTTEQGQGNTPITTATVGSFNPYSAFLVDKNGNVELSLIGFVKVAGLTTSEARELIKEKAKEYYKEPVVNVRIANFDIYLMGEVAGGGLKEFPNERINIVDLIASTGDLPLTAKRKNVLLIRSEGDTKKFVRFDLTSTDIFHSPYYWLKQRDIVYVEPSRFKIQSSDQSFTRNLGIFSSLIGLLTLVLTFRALKF